MLDDLNLLKQRDPGDCLGAIKHVIDQTKYEIEVESGDFEPFEARNVVLAGMGGSALAADMVNVLTGGWLHLPVEVVKGYNLPGYVGPNTLVIAISHSGNTEETLSCYTQAKEKGCTLAAMSTGGKLIDLAASDNLPHVRVPSGSQPRMSTVYHLRGLLKLLQHFQIIDNDLYDHVAKSGDWLFKEVAAWAPEVKQEENYAKQLAEQFIGKTPVFYAGQLTWPLAYKWKISWNESAKNVAFCNQYPEFNHNEFIGWSSHPVEKPFAVVDLRSQLEMPRIRERMELSDRLLSGMRPKASVVELKGEALVEQLLWGLALGDMVSIYAAILNNVNPEPVPLVEKLKKELS
ncbi:bifunctional phosphoglucose/phosphomannose isomerase [Candidatus Saccharibacteria bacterium]|nr:MAG: bifunctional phosphoglucose/phosphomannose isomerase [Candidatus Saccharibacteria bacterium]